MNEEELRREKIIDLNRALHADHAWNSMHNIRAALNFPTGSDFNAPWLAFWGTLTKEQVVLYRTANLSELDLFDLPKPPSPGGES